MTNCLTSHEIEALHDGEISPSQRQAMKLHVVGCDRCRMELESLQQIDRDVAVAHQSIVPRAAWIADMEAMLHADAATEEYSDLSPQKQRLRQLSWLALAASLLLATTLAVMVSKRADKRLSTPAGGVAHEPQSSNSPKIAANDVTADHHRELASNSAVVRAQGDFLVARHPDSGDDIEFYWVLPIQHRQ